LSSDPHQHVEEQQKWLIRKLAHFISHLGQLSGLFRNHTSLHTLLGAAERQWDSQGRYTWHLCQDIGEDQSLVSNLGIIEGTSSTVPDYEPLSSSGCVSDKSPKAAISTDTHTFSPPAGGQQADLIDLDQPAIETNHYTCPKCQEKTVEGSCAWCSFTNIPTPSSQSILSQHEMPTFPPENHKFS
jgi:hypothetical protein